MVQSGFLMLVSGRESVCKTFRNNPFGTFYVFLLRGLASFNCVLKQIFQAILEMLIFCHGNASFMKLFG